ncbi:MAG: GGDEF domain-containing protein [Deltaproteobacteria bacterium]|nr:GGDEF domain-containing protein [Deltaproteobacteria bacterium]
MAIHAATSLDSARMYERMERLATTDGLTGLPNHRTFQLRMDEEAARERRLRTPLSLVLLDIDHFKNINDTYGHPVGDLVLKRVAAMLADAIRDVDMAARYGGEEFALILTNAKPEGAAKLAERLRKSIAREAIPYPGGSLNITVSLGVATMPNDARDKQDLVEAADKALYFSKEHGRNRVTWAGEIRSESAAGADDFTSAPVN